MPKPEREEQNRFSPIHQHSCSVPGFNEIGDSEWQKTLLRPPWLSGRLVTTVSVCCLLLITSHLQGETSLSCHNSLLSYPMSSLTSAYSLAWINATQTKQLLSAPREVSHSLHLPVKSLSFWNTTEDSNDLDFSCVKQEDTSPLAIQTTWSCSARVPYNREESSSPSSLSLLPFFFSFNGRTSTVVETLYFCVMQINQFLRSNWVQRCQDCTGWSYE